MPTFARRGKTKIQYKTMKQAKFSTPVRENVLLAPYTSFNIGGPARFFAEPKTQEECISLMEEARHQRIPVFILGGGTNTLFHDKGFRGLVIRPQLKKICVTENSIIAESGALIAQVVQAAAKHSLSGLEGWIGLPGTVGGAVRGNAGANGVETKDLLTSATIFDLKKNRIEEYSQKNLKFSYRYSLLKKNPHLLLLSATFTFCEKLETKKQQEKMKEILTKRLSSQPKGKNAGCMFTNPTRAHANRRVPWGKTSVDPDSAPLCISAGKLIDECGLKGMRIGGIEISTVHANFLQNIGAATQKDVLSMITLIKKTVYKMRKIRLHEEVQVVGW